MMLAREAGIVPSVGSLDGAAEMPYERLKYSLNQVDKAGECLRDANASHQAKQNAIDVIYNWRAAHALPLNSFHLTLRGRAKKFDPKAVTAQRLKRFDSIWRKIIRFEQMQASQMQDVGGCRAIVRSLKQLNNLRDYYIAHPLRHIAKSPTDYVLTPKVDGYRGIHLMYRYSASDSTLNWNRLRTEIQLRTRLQHAWSTAVETVDAFKEGELKFGGGSADWRRYFQLAGAAIADFEETAPVPGTTSVIAELRDELRDLEDRLYVLHMLGSWATITSHIQGSRSGRDYWYLVEIDPENHSANITSFPPSKLREARAAYELAESPRSPGRKQAVLVSTNTLKSLEIAYPNYFADTALFAATISRFLGRDVPDL